MAELAKQKQRTQIEVTENQRKVIEDKYLRDAPSLEAWMDGVVSNIALGDIIHIDGKKEKALEGVDYKEIEKDVGNGEKSTLTLLHEGKRELDDRRDNFDKFIDNLEELAQNDEECREVWEETRNKFYEMLANFEFLPNSPTLMNAGRDLQQLSACYVLPIEDSMEGWMNAVKNAAMIHKSGGGTGFSVCRVRPKGDLVRSTKGVASGAMSPLKMIDAMTEQVKQGGVRRGANMGIMPYNHPQIEEFCQFKRENELENFNISVAIDRDFMEAVQNDEEFELINPRTDEPEGTMEAQKLWDELIEGAWATGDPGIVVLDRINETRSNPTPHLGEIEATNPCGEQPLLPYEPCNLGSINLSKHVSEDGTDMDWDKLDDTVRTAIHFLDNVIEVNNFPLPEIEEIAKGNRRIGLGVMGWAETCVKLGLSYNSEEAFEKAREVMEFINETALEKSEELAEERGVFPNWKGSMYDPDSEHFGEDQEYRPRHCARTTIAPTGTIGIASGLQGAGIEPFFAVVYTRYNAKALDKIEQGEEPDESNVFYEVNPLFEEIAEEHDHFGLEPEELWKKIEDNHKSVQGIEEIPEDVQRLFPTAHDLTPEEHIRTQAAFQSHTDNAVSKTINFDQDATTEDVEEAYQLAYELGCKGITIYRDGSKDVQVLNVEEEEGEPVEEEDLDDDIKEILKRRRGDVDAKEERSMYYQIDTGHGPLHIHINYDDIGPTRVFANISPSGTEISGLTTAVAILLSKYLELGGDPKRILKHLNSIKGDQPYGFGPNRVDSIPHAISKALRDHLVKSGKLAAPTNQQTLEDVEEGGTAEQEAEELEPETGELSPEEPMELETPEGMEPEDRTPQEGEPQKAGYQADGGMQCPECFSPNVAVLSGCSGPTCFDCNYSECG